MYQKISINETTEPLEPLKLTSLHGENMLDQDDLLSETSLDENLLNLTIETKESHKSDQIKFVKSTGSENAKHVKNQSNVDFVKSKMLPQQQIVRSFTDKSIENLTTNNEKNKNKKQINSQGSSSSHVSAKTERLSTNNDDVWGEKKLL